MKTEILTSINDPKQLERLYRSDKTTFRRTFNALYPELQENILVAYWHERLNYHAEEISWGSRRDIIFIIVAILIAGLTAKIPALAGIDEDLFYPRNIGFILFPALAAFFAWKNKLSASTTAIIAAAGIASLLFINLLPVGETDTLILSCIHLVLFLWSLLGVAFTGSFTNQQERRLAFLKYNGDLVVITTLIVIAGGILSGLTVGLFQLIGISIEQFYFENIVLFALPAAPILGTYLTQANPQLVGKVSPVIAKIFSPLVLVMLVVYMTAMMYSGKDPYNDREFLVIFNALLIGVMAIIFFSVAGTADASKTKADTWILLLLSIVTIVVNCIALSAIVFRISEWGITPNRLAVLGSNLLILVNLLLVTVKLFKVVSGKESISSVGLVIARYLPVYVIWTIIVMVGFHLIF